MLTPRYLQTGDKVGIAAPARKVNPDEIIRGLDWIMSQGWEPVYTPELFGTYGQFSGTDSMRRHYLQKMMDDETIRAIFCVRGGYGVMRIIDDINFDKFIQSPKWIIGYSDITVFHSHLQANFGIESIHGPMMINFGPGKLSDESLQTLEFALCGKQYEIEYTSDLPVIKGEADGIICGGNLSMLYALSGSCSDINTEGKILFIEDLDEYLYHIDRMIIQLKRSGKLAGLAGLIVGGMTDMHDNTVPFGKDAYEIIMEHISGFNYPVAMGFPAGHIKDNRCLIFGRKAHLSVSNQVKLKINP